MSAPGRGGADLAGAPTPPAAPWLRDLRNGWLVGGTAVAWDHPPPQRQQHHDANTVVQSFPMICPSMTLRGVQAHGVRMVTSELLGTLRNAPAARAEFFDLTGVART